MKKLLIITSILLTGCANDINVRKYAGISAGYMIHGSSSVSDVNPCTSKLTATGELGIEATMKEYPNVVASAGLKHRSFVLCGDIVNDKNENVFDELFAGARWYF